MKKVVQIIGIVIASIVLLYALFIIEESIRLSVNKSGKPLIVFNETYSGPNGDITYESLGFKLKYRLYYKSDGLVLTNGQEFSLFDTFLIWSWIS